MIGRLREFSSLCTLCDGPAVPKCAGVEAAPDEIAEEIDARPFPAGSIIVTSPCSCRGHPPAAAATLPIDRVWQPASGA